MATIPIYSATPASPAATFGGLYDPVALPRQTRAYGAPSAPVYTDTEEVARLRVIGRAVTLATARGDSPYPPLDRMASQWGMSANDMDAAIVAGAVAAMRKPTAGAQGALPV